MHEIIAAMIAEYNCRTYADHVHALREIMQEIALLGLWRGKFFDRAAFYGGTALRILHGLDRFSEDMDFTLLNPADEFDLGTYGKALERELAAFGFRVRVEKKDKPPEGPIQSAFLKADTYRQMLVVTAEDIIAEIPKGSVLRIRLEIDTDPPGRFRTESRFLLRPIPFSVRTLTLPCLFAGKMHAVLCRQWKTRVKGRDWYDLVWYVARGASLDLAHLQERMRQSGHLDREVTLTESMFRERLTERIDSLDVDQAREDVAPFVRTAGSVDVWSADFFRDVGTRVKVIGYPD